MITPKNTASYKIKHHNPRHQIATAALVFILFAAYSFGLYRFGYWKSGHNNVVYISTIEQLEEESGFMQDQVLELETQLAAYEQTSNIDEKATKQTQEKLFSMEEDMAELQDELAFYRSIVSPSSMDPGVQIQQFELLKGDIEGEYSFKLILSQRNSAKKVSGKVDVMISGTSQGKGVELSLAEVTRSKQDTLRFSFKYFQSIEGHIVLPVGVKARSVKVLVDPSKRSMDDVEQVYSWQTLLDQKGQA